MELRNRPLRSPEPRSQQANDGECEPCPNALISFAGASPRQQQLLRVAEDSERPRDVSPERLKSRLSEISGKVVDGHRLEKEIDPKPVSLPFAPSGFHRRRIEERS